jgi:serine/threonine protein kinase
MPHPTLLGGDRPTFEAEGTGIPHAYEIRRRADGTLDKIADGTFGAVYRAVETNTSTGVEGEECAVKVFYKSAVRDGHGNFAAELAASNEIRAELKRLHLERRLLGHVVLPIAHTSTLHESPAYDYLCREGNGSLNSASRYALVMPLMVVSLKELLERGFEGGPGGYEILRQLNQSDRELRIAPILDHIARGVRAIHAASKCHHDVKPANILVDYFGGNLRFAVGDLGYLNPRVYAETSVWSVDELPMGTRHYRAPDQRDFFDLCEVDVEVDAQGTRLLTRDPRFADTLMEPGDRLFFSKDPERHAYSITAIEPIPADDDGHGEAGTSGTCLSIDVGVSAHIRKDRRTQVVIYKVHRSRTDLFGLGAVLFDLLSCGKSAERFYDEMRRFDRPGETVERLLSLYQDVLSPRGSNAELARAWRMLRPQRAMRPDYPSSKVVRVLLRCLLGRVEDAYARTDSPAERLLDDLQELGGNVTVPPSDWETAATSGAGVGADDTLSSEIADLRKETRPAVRLAWAYSLLGEIVDLLVDRGGPFLAEAGPWNLERREDRPLGYRSVLYRSDEAYRNAVLAGDTFSLGWWRSGYAPENWEFAIRKVSLERIDVAPEGRPSKWRIEPAEAQAAGSVKITLGDWLIIEGERRVPMDITSVHGDVVELEDPLPGHRRLFAQHVPAVERPAYFAFVVAAYIVCLFFAQDERELFEVTNSVAFARKLRERGWLALEEPARGRRMGIAQLEQHLCWLVLRLALGEWGEDRTRGAGRSNSLEQLEGELLKSTQKLRDLIADVLKLPPDNRALLDAKTQFRSARVTGDTTSPLMKFLLAREADDQSLAITAGRRWAHRLEDFVRRSSTVATE